ncbi:MAG TPA: hypothetical protein VGI57_08595 [Usitatibacter sp.]|jgi:hypothetical protein
MGRWIATAILACIALPCAAQRTYAIVSLVGDQIEIGQHVPGVGSSVDQNRKSRLPIANGAIDKAFLGAADRAIEKTQAGSRSVMLLATDPALYQAQERMIEENASVDVLFERLRPLLAQANATHLVLFTKLRHEARFPLGNYEVGSGTIEGTGFYVDRILMTRVGGTSNDTARGFLAPYAYFQVTLVDLSASTIVKSRTVLGRANYSAARGESGEAWDALTDAEKVNVLMRIARREAYDATVEVIAAP